MAGKGKAKELQVEVKSQQSWDELLTRDGLIVVDAYAAWCGPCKAIISSLKRLKNEIGDDLLIFATAETDSIESLEQYKMRSQPTFLFYAGGTLVNVIRGCNCPVLLKTIRKELEREHKVLEGNAERVMFVDSEVKKVAEEEPVELPTEEEDEEEETVAREMTERRMSSHIAAKKEKVHVPKQVTVAIIKPDAVKAGLVDEIIKKVEEAGIEVLKKEERTLSKEEAAEFYKQHEGSEHFEQLIDFMSSGPLMTLVLSKAGDTPDAIEGIIDSFRDLIGPKDVNIAKEEAPDSLRALYGTDTVQNALHACDSCESAARELAFFFPDYVRPTVTNKRKKRRLQRTLALIRPDALKGRRDSILTKVQESGFEIAMSKEMQLTREQAEEFYSEHKDQEFFETLVSNMISGPMMALCLAREDAVEGWREMLGPKEVEVAKEQAPDSLRAHFQVEESPINPLHGSDSPETAEKEIKTFFPVQSTVAAIKPDVEPDQREFIKQRIKEAGFKIQAQKEITLTKDLASQFYHEHEGKEFFSGLTDYMSSGPTMFMVLQREDAVAGWRSLMGPTDPDQAKEVAPDSLRATLGRDVMKNVVHGSSDPEKAGKVIQEIFPEVMLHGSSDREKAGKVIQEIFPDGMLHGSAKDDYEEEIVAVEMLHGSDKVEENLNEPSVLSCSTIQDASLTASTVLDDGHSASRARLNLAPDGDLKGGWVPKAEDESPWLQVSFDKWYRLTKIATQGEGGESTAHVKSYCLSYSRDGETFVSYDDNNEPKVFEGNSDQDSVVNNIFEQTLLAQHVRVIPKTHSEQIGLRMELFGAEAEPLTQSVGVESGAIPDVSITAFSELDDNHKSCFGRLNAKAEGDKMAAWAAKENDEKQWIQVNFGTDWEVTRVSTQGKGGDFTHHVTCYCLSFSKDGQDFQVYQEGGEDKVFDGNSDQESVVSHWLCRPQVASHVRLHPKTWNDHIALRLDFAGRCLAPPSAPQTSTEPQTEETTTEAQAQSEQPTEKEEPAPAGEAQETEAAASQDAEATQGAEATQETEDAGATQEVEATQEAEIPKEGEAEAKPEEGAGQEQLATEDSAEGESKPQEESGGEPGAGHGGGDAAADSEEPKPSEGEESAAEGGQAQEAGEAEAKPEEGQKADTEVKPAEGEAEGETKPQAEGGEEAKPTER